MDSTRARERASLRYGHRGSSSGSTSRSARRAVTMSWRRWSLRRCPAGADRASSDGSASRALHADGASIAFALRCYVAWEAPADEGSARLRPLQVHVVVTGDYLVTLHEERVSLPAVLARTCRRNAAGDTSSTPSSTRCSQARSTRWTRSS